MGREEQRPGSARVVVRSDTAAVRRTVLPSGLRVVTEQVPGSRSAGAGLWVDVGSRDETRPQAGAAHYLEHLLFKGTERRSAAGIAAEVDVVGGELNAFTAKEHTCFYAQVLDEDLPLAVDVLCDVVFAARNTARDVELERRVVFEEMAMRDDDPEDALGELFTESLFGGHPLGRSVLGTEESVQGMSRARVHGFYRRHYRPERMVLSAAGNVDHERLVRQVRQALGERFPAGQVPRPLRTGGGRFPRQRPLALQPSDTEQAHVLVGCRGLDRYDERRYSLGVLNAALGGGMSSRLFQQVRERRGLAYAVHSDSTAFSDSGMFSVYAGCAPDRLGEVCALVREVLGTVAREGLSEEEVRRGRGQLRGALVLGLEDTAARMVRVGKRELNHGQHESVERALERIDAVTAEQVAALAGELLTRPLATAVVGPYEREADLPDGAVGPARGGRRGARRQGAGTAQAGRVSKGDVT
ncbi:M16 family metallopeptidase [Salinifilum ghardaiensis]